MSESCPVLATAKYMILLYATNGSVCTSMPSKDYCGSSSFKQFRSGAGHFTTSSTSKLLIKLPAAISCDLYMFINTRPLSAVGNYGCVPGCRSRGQ